MNLLTTIAVSNHDAVHAERLLDFIHHQSGRQGHLLLGIQSNVHDEMKSRIKISAGLAFHTVHEIELRPLADNAAPKTAQANNSFRQMAEYINQRVKWPWLWLEADCTPAIPDWRAKLAAAYHDQPMHYFGTRMKIKPKSGNSAEIFFMARVGIYPANAFTDLMPSELFVPIEIASAKMIQPKLGTTKLFQAINIATEADLISVREDAILVHGDKHGYFLKSINLEEVKPEPVNITVTEAPKPRLSRRMVREMNGATT